MRFFKFGQLVRYDICHGIFKPYKRLIPAVLFLLIALLGMDITAKQMGMVLSAGDFAAYVVRGVLPDTPNGMIALYLPLVWFLFYLFPVFYLGSYPTQDLQGTGAAVLLRSGNRKLWWLSKVCMTVIGCGLYMGILLALSLLFGAKNGSCSLFLTQRFADFLQIPAVMTEAGTAQLIYTFLLPLGVLVTMALVQLSISFVWRPAGAMVIVVLIYAASVYRVSPWLVPEYGMLLRTDRVIPNGVSPKNGAVLMLLVSLMAVYVGGRMFCRYDILNNDKEV